ncbi:MAG: hypothetical protein WC455_12060 [Dehalococcoidia bacterium]
MVTQWQVDLKWSAAAFIKSIWPAISLNVGGGNLIPVEDTTDNKDFMRTLDQEAGIDAWQVIKDKGVVRGIASRVQKIERNRDGIYKPFNSFTIRYRRTSGSKTEYEKRLYAITHKSSGNLFPGFTVQGYINADTGQLISAAIVKTFDLFKHIEQGIEGKDKDYIIQSNGSDGNEFIVVYWSKLVEAGRNIKIVQQRVGVTP